MKTLERLLFPISTADFFEKYWEAQHLYITGRDSDYYHDVLTIEDIDQCLAMEGLHFPGIGMAKDGSRLNPLHLRRKPQRNNRYATADSSRVMAMLHDSNTLLLNGIHKRINRTARWCEKLADNMQLEVFANTYVTPADSYGFDIHYDLHDVFVLHLSGTKEWRIYDTPISLPTESHTNRIPTTDTLEPIATYVLKPGDLLYIPRGMRHSAHGVDDTAIHVTMGLHPVLIHDIFSVCSELAIEDESFRKSLPMWKDDADAVKDAISSYTQALAEWMKTRPVDEIMTLIKGRIINATAASKTGRFQDFLEYDQITMKTLFSVREHLQNVCYVKKQEIIIRSKDGELPFPIQLEEMIRFMLGQKSFHIEDVPGELPDEVKLELAQRLVKEGLLTIKPVS